MWVSNKAHALGQLLRRKGGAQTEDQVRIARRLGLTASGERKTVSFAAKLESAIICVTYAASAEAAGGLEPLPLYSSQHPRTGLPCAFGVEGRVPNGGVSSPMPSLAGAAWLSAARQSASAGVASPPPVERAASSCLSLGATLGRAERRAAVEAEIVHDPPLRGQPARFEREIHLPVHEGIEWPIFD